jgi:hypothetical protein
MGTPNAGSEGGFGGIPNSLLSFLTNALGAATAPLSAKGSKISGAQKPKDFGLPPLDKVPTATAGFNAELPPAERVNLLRAMIARAKSGGVPPAPASGS